MGLRRWHGIDAVSIDTSRKEIVLKIQIWLKSSYGLIVVAVGVAEMDGTDGRTSCGNRKNRYWKVDFVPYRLYGPKGAQLLRTVCAEKGQRRLVMFANDAVDFRVQGLIPGALCFCC